jgi:hypothetical protein
METIEFIGCDIDNRDIDNLMGEFMREQDVALLREIIHGGHKHVDGLRLEMTLGPDIEARLHLASHYRRGVQLCMRYAYWKSMKVPEDAVFTDASGCIWTAPEQENHQPDMLVMHTAQAIPIVSLPSREEDESWLRAIGFLDALDHLQSY